MYYGRRSSVQYALIAQYSNTNREARETKNALSIWLLIVMIVLIVFRFSLFASKIETMRAVAAASNAVVPMRLSLPVRRILMS
jgi:hypothetical protein